jgi:hypothetical protein
MASGSSLHILQSSEAAVRLREAQAWLSARMDGGALVVSASRGAADDLVRAAAFERGASPAFIDSASLSLPRTWRHPYWPPGDRA